MSDMQHPPGGQAITDESVAELVKRAASQTAELVRKEIQLGQVELKDKAGGWERVSACSAPQDLWPSMAGERWSPRPCLAWPKRWSPGGRR